MSEGESYLSEEDLEDLEMGLEPLGMEGAGEPDIQVEYSETLDNYGSEYISGGEEADPNQESEGNNDNKKDIVAGGGQHEAVMTPEQYAENDWQKTHTESGVYRYDQDTGKLFSGDGKICITDLITAEWKENHLQLLEGFRNNPGAGQVIEHIEPMDGGYRLNHTLIHIEGDGSMVSETWSKEFLTTQEVVDDDDSDLDQVIDDDEDEYEATAPEIVNASSPENNFSFSFFAQTAEVTDGTEVLNASMTVEQNTVAPSNLLGIRIEMQPVPVEAIEPTMDAADLDDEDYSDEIVEVRAFMNGSEKVLSERVVVEAPSDSVVDTRGNTALSRSVEGKEYAVSVNSEPVRTSGIQKKYEVSTDTSSVDGISIMELSVNDEPNLQLMITESREISIGEQWIPVKQEKIVESLGIEIINDNAIQGGESVMNEDQGTREVITVVNDRAETIVRPDDVIDTQVDTKEIQQHDVIPRLTTELKKGTEEISSEVKSAEIINTVVDAHVEAFEQQTVSEFPKSTRVENEEIMDVVRSQIRNGKNMETVEMNESTRAIDIKESGEIKQEQIEPESTRTQGEQFSQEVLKENVEVRPSVPVIQGSEKVSDNQQRIDTVRIVSRSSEFFDRVANLRNSGIYIEEEEVTETLPRVERELQRAA